MSNKEQVFTAFRKAFESWYVEHVNLEASPTGSRDYILQWRAWDGAAQALSLETIELKRRVNELEATSKADAIDKHLDFEPDKNHTVADMANIGYAFMQALKTNRPLYCWNDSPAEIIGDLCNDLDEARESQGGTT